MSSVTPPVPVKEPGRELFSLSELSAEWVAFYFFPGTSRHRPAGGLESPAHDTAQQRSFYAHRKELCTLGVRAFGISSQTEHELVEMVSKTGIRETLLVAPDIACAESLGLPTFEHAGRRWYRRCTLLAYKGVIRWVFYPIERPENNPQQIITWLHLHQHQSE